MTRVATPQTHDSAVLRESYDDVPYESYAYLQTHPERLYTVGKLFGLNPPDIHKAKILEIGCAMGGNIIPLAALYPKCQILGVDLSEEQITQANEHKKAMGLKNIEFRAADITTVKDLGEYDYIICHGVFSWVPDFVRDKIFDICRDHLSPDGMAVISYNTLPGWAAVKSLREMMIFHAGNFTAPAQQIHEARSLLNFLYENTPPSNEAYRQIIDRERNILKTTNDSYLFHEHLESENHQYYLHQFVDMARRHDLAYVGDSDIATMYVGNFNQHVKDTLSKIKDAVRQEQYIDFLTNRRFRQSILTSAKNASRINRGIDSQALNNFYMQARFKFDVEESKKTGKAHFKIGDSGAKFDTADSVTGEILKALALKDRPVMIEEIAKELKKKAKIDPEKTKDVLTRTGLALALQHFITVHSDTAYFVTEVSKKPRAFAWARHLTSTQKNVKMVTNVKRESVNLTPLLRAILMHLDGKNTIKNLVELVTENALKGEIHLHRQNVKITDKKEIADILTKEMEPALKRIAALALLEA